MSSRIGDLTATTTVVGTDLFEKEQAAFAASEKITAAALKTALFQTILTAGDQVKLGAAPDAAGAVTIDASSFSTTALSIKNGATTATITLASGATLTIGPALAVSGSAPTLQLNTTTATGIRTLYKAAVSGVDKWGLGLDASTQFVVLNAALNTANLTITDAGAVTTRAGVTITTGGLTVTAGGATITAGGIAVTAGGITVSSGGFKNAGGSLSSGGYHYEMPSTATSAGISTDGSAPQNMTFQHKGGSNTNGFWFGNGVTGVAWIFKMENLLISWIATADLFKNLGTFTDYQSTSVVAIGNTGPTGLISANPYKWIRITESGTGASCYFPIWK